MLLQAFDFLDLVDLSFVEELEVLEEESGNHLLEESMLVNG